MHIIILLSEISFKIIGPDTPDAILQRDAIFRISLTDDNFDPSLNFPNIYKCYDILSYLVTYLSKFALIGCFINFQKLKNRHLKEP
jgi:hypothetical protein